MLKGLEAAGVKEGKIGIVNVNAATASCVAREKGFRSAFEGKGFELLETQYCEGDAAKSKDIAANYITSGCVGIFGANEGSTVGIGNAIQESGGKIVGVGFDKSDTILELIKSGYRYVVDADLKGYFDTIPHDRLMQEVRKRVADGRVLSLIEAFLEAKILEGLEQWTPMAGAPQGAVLSPLLSNIYLNPLDHRMAGQGYEMVRYADDFVILCRSKQEAETALEVGLGRRGGSGFGHVQTRKGLV
jgi:hypothetical protein